MKRWAYITTLLWAAVALAGPVTPDSPMYLHPDLGKPEEQIRFAPGLAELWRWALEQPDTESRRRACDAIADAHRMGLAGLSDLAPLLVTKLDDEPLVVRLAAARALAALDHREAGPTMLRRQAIDGIDMQLLTDPVLAAWDTQGAREVWRARAADTTRRQMARRSAIESLAAVADPEALPMLLALAQSSEAAALRLSAARAAARAAAIETSDAKPLIEAATLLARAQMLDRLIAAELLTGVKTPAARPLLLSLAGDTEATVAAVAWLRLNELREPGRLRLAVDDLQSPDANVRQLAAEALLHEPSSEQIEQAALLLDDPIPAVRSGLAKRLAELHAAGVQREAVEAEVSSALKSRTSWRASEQAAWLVGRLELKPMGDRLLPLLNHARPEVRVAAAVAIRRLALTQMLPAVLSHVQEMVDRSPQLREAEMQTIMAVQAQQERLDAQGPRESDPENQPLLVARLITRVSADSDAELSELVQMLGHMRYREAEPLMRQLLPKGSVPWPDTRAAAIWSLGLFYEDNLDTTLATRLVERMRDTSPVNPEFPAVRLFSAISLGRMKAPQAVPALRKIYVDREGMPDLPMACRWAAMRITGEPLPPVVIVVTPKDWFLEPMIQDQMHEPAAPAHE